jgi:arsenite-transporting ATPase
MRILLYTGKGGVGKTSVSAATALRCAELGYRTVVISTDSAHSLADSFDQPLGPEPTPIADHLWGQELDVLYQMDRYWGTVQDYLASMFAWRGLQSIIAEEASVLPGMEELASLLQIIHLHDSGDYDVIIIDAAPTGATLQLLTIPEMGRWYIQKILPLQRKALAMGSPLLRAISDMPIPDERIFDAIVDLHEQLDRMHRLLSDRLLSSARLVLNPEKMVIKETQRTYTYLTLYGYSTDAIICNRMFPQQAAGTYFDEWREIQAHYMETVEASFTPLPILSVPFFAREVVGLDMLREMGAALFAGRDPTEVLYAGKEQKIVQVEGGYQLYIPLPLVSGSEIELTRSSHDELIVHIGNRKHLFSLPRSLAAMHVESAKQQGDTLCVTFRNEAKP